ncbi:unnamed protein product, partial [Mesorhabditis spiculigera]
MLAHTICLLAFYAACQAVPMMMAKPYTDDKFNPFGMETAPKSDMLWPMYRDYDGFRNMDVDGVEAESIPDEEKGLFPAFKTFNPKLPQMPFDSQENQGAVDAQQPGVAPKFTGKFEAPKPEDKTPAIDEAALKELDPDYVDAPVSNPATYFLEGANLEKVSAPKCQMIGCTGPVPNDGSIQAPKDEKNADGACHTTFVPLNGCLDGKGYPMGMMCQICCDCARSFVQEMQKSRGVRTGYVEPK